MKFIHMVATVRWSRTLLLAASSTPRANTKYPTSSDMDRLRCTKLWTAVNNFFLIFVNVLLYFVSDVFVIIYRWEMKKMMVNMRQTMDMDRPMYDTIESALELICSRAIEHTLIAILLHILLLNLCTPDIHQHCETGEMGTGALDSWLTSADCCVLCGHILHRPATVCETEAETDDTQSPCSYLQYSHIF